MPSAIAEHAASLEAEINEIVDTAETIYRNAREEGRDLLESEQVTLDRLATKRDAKNADLVRATKAWQPDAEVTEKLKRLRGGTPVVYRSAGELLWDMLHAQTDTDAADRYRRTVIVRAAEHLGLDKANTVPVAGGYNGLVVASNVGPVLDPYPGDMPLFTALDPQPITGATFNRPRIVDPNFARGVAGGLQE